MIALAGFAGTAGCNSNSSADNNADAAAGLSSSSAGTSATGGSASTTGAGGRANVSVAGSSATGDGLEINASLGVNIADRLIGAETSYAIGVVMVTNNGTAVSDAVVTVNGVVLPGHVAMGVAMAGYYSLDDAAITKPTAAGSTVTLTATQGGKTATLALDCPKEVTLTSPVESTAVKAAQVLNVTWNGSLDTGNAAKIAASPGTLANLYKPDLNFYHWDGTSTGKLGMATPVDTNGGTLEPTATSGTITVPDPIRSTLVLSLHVKGKAVQYSARMAGSCNLSRRVVLPASP